LPYEAQELAVEDESLKQKEQFFQLVIDGVPTGIRTPVFTVKG
jgi:hypothetical protein